MKRYMMLVYPFLLLFLQFDTSNATAVTDIEQLISLVQQHNPDASISGWTVVVRDEQAKSSSDIGRLFQKENQFTFVQTDRSSMTASKDIPQLRMQVSARIIAQGDEKSMILYTVSGNKWNTDSRIFLLNLLARQSFSDDAKSFSCLTGLTDGNMDKDSLKMRSKWLDDFDAKMIEQTEEEGFLSCSAESQFFTNGLANHMNLQFAFRSGEGDGSLRFTVGTPIIINEY